MSDEVNKITRLRVLLNKRKISQKDLAQWTFTSTNTINKLINEGKATKSIIKLVGYELGLTYEEMNWYLEEIENEQFKSPPNAPER
jgi:hypothetical protein